MFSKHAALPYVMLFTLSAFAQKSPVTTTYYPATPLPGVKSSGPTMAMPTIGPLFIEDDHFSSSLMLVNNTSQAAGATITLRDLNGILVSQRHIVLDQSSQKEFLVRDLLASGNRHSSLGSISVLQDHELQGAAVNSQLLITDRRNPTPGYLDEELAMPSMEGSSVLRGVTDSADGPALLAITNISSNEQNVTVTCIRAKHQPKTASIAISAHGTSLTRACSQDRISEMTSFFEDQTQKAEGVVQEAEGVVQGIEITGSAGPGTLAAFAFATHAMREKIVLSTVPMTDPKSQGSSTIIYTGVPFGFQTVLPDGTYLPRISLANFSDKVATITVSVASSQSREVHDGASPNELHPQAQVRTISLAAKESRELVFDDVPSAGLLHSISITSDQVPGQVESKVVSRGSGALYQVELLGKDTKDPENGGGHPWTTRGDSESTLLLFNHSASSTTFTVHIPVGSSLWTKKYSLVSNETREISINQLIRDGVKDDGGQVIGTAYQEGIVLWSVTDPGNGRGRLLVSSQAANSARNFSCGYTVIVCGLGVSVNYSGVIPLLGGAVYGNSFGQYCLAWGPGVCTGGTPTSSGGAGFTWNLGDTSIVGFNTPSDQYSSSPTFYGNNIGSTYAAVSAYQNGCSSSGSGSPSPVVQTCPTTLTVSQIFRRTLPSIDYPSSLTGVGILTRMLASPLVSDYTGTIISEIVTPMDNTCPDNIKSYTSFPNTYSLFTIGDQFQWEGVPFPSVANSFYDSHRQLADTDLLGFTSGAQCYATATQVYSCSGRPVGSFTLTNTYTHGNLSGQPVTNVETTKQ